MNRIVSLLRFPCLAFCAACFAPSARAATLNVPAQYATIQFAVTAANAGDTILVADGTYTGAGNRDVDFGGRDLIVQSASGNPANCVIDCQQAGCAFILSSGLTAKSVIAGFTIKNGAGHIAPNGYACGGGIYALGYPDYSGSSPIITHCVFTINSAKYGGGLSGGVATHCVFNGNSGLYYGGGMEFGAAFNCVFSGNSGELGGGGIYSGSATNCVFNGNSASGGGGMFFGSATNCVFTRNSAGGGGAAQSELRYCTVANNTAQMMGGVEAGSGNTVVNCIIWGNTAGGMPSNFDVEIYNGQAPYVTYSDIQGGYAGTGNINADPLFVNAATGDYHLTFASPCINVGTANYVGLPATDFDGNSRITGAAPDMGAYEFPNPVTLVSVSGVLTFRGLAASASNQNVTFLFRPVSGGADVLSRRPAISRDG